MKDTSSTRRSGLSIFVALALIVGAYRAHGTDIYNPLLNQLTIPLLRIGHVTYSNVVLTVGSIVTAPNGIGTVNWDTYDPVSGQLTIAEVNVGNSVYYGAGITVARLLSIGSATSADTFDGKNLTVPYAQVGSSIYYNVVLGVSAADVVNVKGGMPDTSIDQYNGSTGQLAIGAVRLGSGFLTNVSLRVGPASIVSVGGHETVLYSFQGKTDGYNPVSALMMDASGKLFGTNSGGNDVFELSPAGSGGYVFNVLHTFGGAGDGSNPQAGLIPDAGGNLYGTTMNSSGVGYGTVFRLAPDGAGGYTESVLYTFKGGSDGASPRSSLVVDSRGNLYGTTFGQFYYPGAANVGTVFELSPNGSGGYDFSVLYAFQGGNDGANPLAGLSIDNAGNLYGTASAAGSGYSGTAFELTPNGRGGYDFSVLYAFQGGADGAVPVAGLTLDVSGNLYGTASAGGNGFGQFGTVFQLAPRTGGGYDFRVLYAFQGGADGASPAAGLIVDARGNLYGTTSAVNALTSDFFPSYRGTIFRLSPNGSGGFAESVLYGFLGGADGGNPYAGLVMDTGGNLYGTTLNGGAGSNGYGVVFAVK